MAKNGYPEINQEKRSNCGTCINFCKHGAYDKEKTVPIVIFPDGCIDKCRGFKIDAWKAPSAILVMMVKKVLVADVVVVANQDQWEEEKWVNVKIAVF